jgi:hypothetical protein
MAKCKYGKDYFGSIKSGELFEKLVITQQRRTLFHGISLCLV